MMKTPKNRPTTDQLIHGILNGDRILLSKAITIVESKLPSDRLLATQILDEIGNKNRHSIRIGITGVPGVGKSTFIESFGKLLTSLRLKVAVLSIDPSSALTRGSILGDKTRMNELAQDPLAYIRPSPSGNTLGGVAHKTRETITLCEAAAFDVIIVETVGVGQSETAVKGMVDFFLLLMIAGAGDELQGIKRGIMEMADALVINKADGQNLENAKRARKSYENALHLFPASQSNWITPALICSAVEKTGIDEIWEIISAYKKEMTASGFFENNRSFQNINWLHEIIREMLESNFYMNPETAARRKEIEQKVAAGGLSVRHAVELLFSEK